MEAYGNCEIILAEINPVVNEKQGFNAMTGKAEKRAYALSVISTKKAFVSLKKRKKDPQNRGLFCGSKLIFYLSLLRSSKLFLFAL